MTPEQRKQASAAYWAAVTASRARAPLTTGQHILHLILTIVTGGAWGIVWAIRASRGNRVPIPGIPQPQWNPPEQWLQRQPGQMARG